MGRAYYNEIDLHAAQWLRNLIDAGLIAPGDVDTRSIVDVTADDLRGYVQCHFFAGIGGWSLALRLAGWPDDRPVWTGSCPCQPFSAAGKRRGTDDERHLWPEFYRIIRECMPAIVFGEQVASKAGLGWLDGVCADLEASDYACGAADLPAAGLGAPHIRQRLFWVGVRLAYASGPALERDTGRFPTPQKGIGSSRQFDGRLHQRLTDGGDTQPLRLANPQLQHARPGIAGEQGHAGVGRDRPAIDGAADGLAEPTSQLGERGRHEPQRRPEGRVADGGAGAGADGPEHAQGDGRLEGRAEPERRGAAGGCGQDLPAWQPCDCCDEFWCNIHDQHAFECPCPPINEWDTDPYAACGLGHAPGGQPSQHPQRDSGQQQTVAGDGWADAAAIPCRDGKWRRISAQSGDEPLAHGIPRDVGRRFSGLAGMAKAARGNRVGRLKGYGNAIVPQVVAAFVRAVIDSTNNNNNNGATT